MPAKECLPADQVLAKVAEIEKEVVTFYERARDLTIADAEVAGTFTELLGGSHESIKLTERMCAQLKCGEAALEGATQEDLHFLTALTEGSFYKNAGRPAELADPTLHAEHLLDNAIKLEKDLLLFYLKFYGVSCVAHRPLFSELVSRGQAHVGTLQRVRARLQKELDRG